MGRDKRIYRFVQDTRFGRIVLAESHDVPVIVDAVTDYVARRMIEREHAMVATPIVEPVAAVKPRRSGFWTFVLGFMLGAAALFGLALFASLRESLDQPRLAQLRDTQAVADASHGLLAAPGITVALDRKQIVGGGRIMAVRQRRRRRHADRGNFAVRAVEPHGRMDVVVAVQNEVDAVPLAAPRAIAANRSAA